MVSSEATIPEHRISGITTAERAGPPVVGNTCDAAAEELIPETRFTAFGDDRIAFQAFGTGELDLLMVSSYGDGIGTNWAFELDAEVAYLQHAGCVIFVTVGTDESVLPGPMPEFLSTMVSHVAAQHPNMHVLDWGNIEYLEPSWLEPDHVHPTAAGAHELASLELQALQMDCR